MTFQWWVKMNLNKMMMMTVHLDSILHQFQPKSYLIHLEVLKELQFNQKSRQNLKKNFKLKRDNLADAKVELKLKNLNLFQLKNLRQQRKKLKARAN